MANKGLLVKEASEANLDFPAYQVCQVKRDHKAQSDREAKEEQQALKDHLVRLAPVVHRDLQACQA